MEMPITIRKLAGIYGKGRSLMSRPHTTKDLNFSQHPTKPNRYISSHSKTARTPAWLAIGFGVAVLCTLASLILVNLL